MRVKAIKIGHTGQPVTVTRIIRYGMTEKAIELAADLIQPGDEFEWDKPLGNWMQPVVDNIDVIKTPVENNASVIKQGPPVSNSYGRKTTKRA